MFPRRTFGTSALCLSLLVGCASMQDPAPSSDAGTASSIRNITVYLGQRSLEEDDWAPVEDQGTLGVEYVTQAPGAAVGWEFGLQFSADDETLFVPGPVDVEASTVELYAGARKTFNQQADLQPYVGGGLSLLTIDLEASGAQTVSDDDSVIGCTYTPG